MKQYTEVVHVRRRPDLWPILGIVAEDAANGGGWFIVNKDTGAYIDHRLPVSDAERECEKRNFDYFVNDIAIATDTPEKNVRAVLDYYLRDLTER